LRESLKHCSPAALAAADALRYTGDPVHLPVFVRGLVTRFAGKSSASSLGEADDDKRLVEDLGLDSLSLMELMLVVEDVLGFSISNEQLGGMRTIRDVCVFLETRLRAREPRVKQDCAGAERAG
jgi:acyl carrier protein